MQMSSLAISIKRPGRLFMAAGLLLASPAAGMAQDVPAYRVDPFWPKPLPNKWIMQQVVDIQIDPQDHVWMINRPDPRPDETGATAKPPRTECCVIGPEIMQFDTDGNLLKSFGSAGITGWPQRLQSLEVDRAGKDLARLLWAQNYRRVLMDKNAQPPRIT